MYLADYHIHSHFSGDSEESFKNIVSFAQKKHLSEICITDHQDFDFYADDILFELNEDEYFTSISNLAKNHPAGLIIKKGVEIGLEPDKADKIRDFIHAKPFDFVIGSSHLVHGMDPYYREYFEGKTDTEAFMEYFESIIENLKFCSDFDVYGHIDYVVRYSPNKNKNYSYSKFGDILDEILKQLIYKGKGIEVNTSGYRSGLEAPNPCFDIIKRYQELGGEIITIGSDAHTANDIGSHFDEAVNLIQAAGLSYLTTFTNRKPSFIKI